MEDEAKKNVGAMRKLTGIINGLASGIGQWRSGDKVGGAGTILDMLIPGAGGLFSAGASLVNAFKKKAPQVIERIIEPVRIASESLSMFLGANPASRLYGGRGSVGGAAFQSQIHTHVYLDGDKVAESVSTRLYDWNTLEGAYQ